MKINDNKILDLLNQGYSRAEIANKLNISSSTVYRHKKKLIELGEITEEEIKLNQNNRRKKLTKLTSTQKRILKLFNDGYTEVEIANKLNMTQPNINRYKKKLIELDKITEEEIIEAQKERKANKKVALTKKQKTILRGLKAGKEIPKIAKSASCSKEYTRVTRKNLLNNNLITKEDLDKVPIKLTKKQQLTLNYLKKGHTVTEIAETLKVDVAVISKRKKKLIENEYITEEEIIEAQEERKNLEDKLLVNKNIKLTDTQKNILKLLKQGYTEAEIADKLKLKFPSNVNYHKKKLIKLGKVTEDEIEKAKEKRKSKKLTNTQKEVLKLLKQGYNSYQIGDKLKISPKTIYDYRDTFIKLQLINEEELKNKEEQIIKYLNEGKTVSEIMKLVDCSESYIYQIKRNLDNEEDIEVLKIDEEIEVLKLDEDDKLTIEDKINTLKALNDEDFINKVLDKKLSIEKNIISLRLGLADGNNYSVDDISNMINISCEEVCEVLSIFFNELGSYIKNKTNINKGSLKFLNREEN